MQGHLNLSFSALFSYQFACLLLFVWTIVSPYCQMPSKRGLILCCVLLLQLVVQLDHTLLGLFCLLSGYLSPSVTLATLLEVQMAKPNKQTKVTETQIGCVWYLLIYWHTRKYRGEEACIVLCLFLFFALALRFGVHVVRYSIYKEKMKWEEEEKERK